MFHRSLGERVTPITHSRRESSECSGDGVPLAPPRSADTDKKTNTRSPGEDREMTRRIWAALIAAAMALALAVPVLADHDNDGGQDEAWSNDMNQTSYWESRFGAECTKFENHSGYIPAQYDAAVVKDGNYVRVYDPAPSPFTALGAVNPANGNHFGAPHSWVMKCRGETRETTTTTEPETTTTTQPTTTTTEPRETTYDCIDGEIVEVNPGDEGYPGVGVDPSVFECGEETTTTQPPATTPPELPFTGIDVGLLAVAAAGMIALGGTLAYTFRDRLS